MKILIAGLVLALSGCVTVKPMTACDVARGAKPANMTEEAWVAVQWQCVEDRWFKDGTPACVVENGVTKCPPGITP